MSDNEPKVIVDRVATDGSWFIEVNYYTGKRRKSHYFNDGSNRPVCGEHSITMKNAVRATHEGYGELNVEPEEVREDRHGNPITYGTACRHCLSIVVDGIDLKATHARRALDIPAAAADEEPPTT